LVAYEMCVFVCFELVGHGLSGPDSSWAELIRYPFSALLSGLAFFVMGSNYWGRCYAVGLAFFAFAALMPLNLEWAPLRFGGLWAVTLLAMGLHLRQLGGGAEAASPPRQSV